MIFLNKAFVFLAFFSTNFQQTSSEHDLLKQWYDSASYYYDADPKKSLEFSTRAIELAGSLSGKAQNHSELYLLHAKTQLRRGQNADAKKWALRSIESAHDVSVLSEAYSLLGSIYSRHDLFDSAKYFLEMAISLDKSPESLLRNNGRLGVLHKTFHRYEDAIKYYQKTLDISSQLGDTLTIAKTYINLANVYYLHGDMNGAEANYLSAISSLDTARYTYSLSGMYLIYGSFLVEQGNLDRAEEFMTRSKEMADKYDLTQTRLEALGRLGNLDMKRGDYLRAISRLNESIELKKPVGDSAGLYYNYCDLSESYLMLGDLGRSAIYANRAMRVARSHNDLLKLSETHELMSELDSARGRYQEALMHYKKHTAYKDSLFDIEKSKVINELNIRYESQQKEKTISEQRLAIGIQQRENLIFGILLVFFTVLCVFIYFYFRLRNRALKKEASMKMYEEVALMKEKVQESLARDIHDSLGQSLIAARLSLEPLADDKTLGDRVKSVLDVLKASYAEVRKISHKLIPIALEKQGLASALEELVHNYLRNRITDSSFEYLGPAIRFSESIEINLYRIAQELISNIIKHSQATEVNVRLYMKDNFLILLVAENGIGFMNGEHGDGLGLSNMRARTKMLKGDFSIQSGAEEVIVIVKVPLNGAEA